MRRPRHTTACGAGPEEFSWPDIKRRRRVYDRCPWRKRRRAVHVRRHAYYHPRAARSVVDVVKAARTFCARGPPRVRRRHGAGGLDDPRDRGVTRRARRTHARCVVRVTAILPKRNRKEFFFLKKKLKRHTSVILTHEPDKTWAAAIVRNFYTYIIVCAGVCRFRFSPRNRARLQERAQWRQRQCYCLQCYCRIRRAHGCLTFAPKTKRIFYRLLHHRARRSYDVYGICKTTRSIGYVIMPVRTNSKNRSVKWKYNARQTSSNKNTICGITKNIVP